MEKRNEQLEILEDVHELLTEALKLMANEPSVGLYFVQQHVHKAVPALLTVKEQLTETTVDAELATADAKDSLSCIRTMKECGPPVIERMIKTLKSASNTIPVPRQSRGSVSQLLPRPVRPPGLGKGPLRSSSFLGDWHSDTSSSKTRENFQRDRPLDGTGNKKELGGRPALPVPDPKKAELSQKKITIPDQQVTPISAGCDSSDVTMNKESLARLPENEVSSSDPPRYMRALLGSAFLKAGSVSREGVKLIRRDVESQLVGDGRVAELKNWITGQGLLGFTRKIDNMPEKLEGQVQPMESGISREDLIQMQDKFEDFQAERAVKLEAWLNESDGTHSMTS